MTDPTHDIKAGSLADFLRAKRAQVQPDEVGLPEGRRRRTPGLRREELAELAGVGVSWYTSLEQGRDINPSEQVLRNLAAALKLTPAETRHIFFLAGRLPPTDLAITQPSISPALSELVNILSPRPALIANKQWDWLAWNKAADFFFEITSDTAVPERNTLWQVFKGKRDMPDADWEAYARMLVGRLRASPHLSRDTGWFKELVQHLMEEGKGFKRIWNRYEVADISETTEFVHHSELGRVTVEVLTFLIPTMVDAWLVIFMVDRELADKLAERLA